MDRHEERTRVQRTQRIRALNDQLRKTGFGGKIFLTRAIADLGAAAHSKILAAIRSFDAFTTDNDPWGEHDFGQVVIGRETYLWKIDYYDLDLEYASPDPADTTVTRRVLTIMTAHDL